MDRPPLRFSIYSLGRYRRYELQFVPYSAMHIHGDCDHPHTKGKKLIRVRANLAPIVELETVIHEIGHLNDWGRDEAIIDHLGRDVAKVLWALGWRRTAA